MNHIIFFPHFLKSFIEVYLIYKVVVFSAVQQRDSVIHYTHPFFFRFFLHIDYHRILGRVSCAIQSHIIFTHSSMFFLLGSIRILGILETISFYS